MKIRAVGVCSATMPYKRLYAVSGVEARLVQHVIVRIHRDEGMTGLGGAATEASPYFVGESNEAVA